MSEAIAWLGGSFDPVHRGHLQLARAALQALPISRLYLLPAAQPWQKSMDASPSQRAAMLSLALAGEAADVRARVAIDARELQREGPTYTVDTLRELRAEMPSASIVLVMGADQFERFDSWHDWQTIGELAHLAIARRAGQSPHLSPALERFANPRQRAASAVAEAKSGFVVEVPMHPVDASSTEVRQLLANRATDEGNQRLAAMVAPAVLDYIRTHHLYLARDGH